MSRHEGVVHAFLEACKFAWLHDKWYTMDRISFLMSEGFRLNKSRLSFTGEELLEAFQSHRYRNMMRVSMLQPEVAHSPQRRQKKKSTEPAPSDKFDYFFDRYHEHDCTTTWYVYVTKLGQRPSSRADGTSLVLKRGAKELPPMKPPSAPVNNPKLGLETAVSTTGVGDPQVPVLALEPDDDQVKQADEKGDISAEAAMPLVLISEAASAAAAQSDPEEQQPLPPPPPPPRASETMALQSYWTSSDATKMFRPVEGETTLMAIQNQIAVLHDALKHDLARVLQGGEEALAALSPFGVARLREQAMLVALVLSLANREASPDKILRFEDCCKKASQVAHMMAFSKGTNAQTIRRYYRQFRENRVFLPPKYHQNGQSRSKLDSDE